MPALIKPDDVFVLKEVLWPHVHFYRKQVEIIESVLLNDEGAPGKVTITRSVIHGATGMIAGAGDDTPAAGAAYIDGGGNRTDDPLLGDDLRPRPGSPALGLAGPAPGGAIDLEGRARAGTAGALEAASAGN